MAKTKHNLGFFLSKLMSLSEWDKIGMLSREIAPYNILATYFDHIYIFSYGDKKELEYQKYLAPNITIIPKKPSIPKRLYSFLLPVLHRKTIKKCAFLKTNQIFTAESLLLSKIINPKAKLIIRSGYCESLTDKKNKKYFRYLKYSLLEYFAYKFCQIGIVTTQKIKDYITLKYHLHDNKIKIIPNYVNTELFQPVKTGFKHVSTNRLIFIGRLNPEKNLTNLIRALKDTNITLDIVGNGALKNKLQNLAQELNVKINFLGSIPNNQLPDILNKYKIFILPSLYEGMPKTLLEAMSCGLACIGTKVEGIKEIIQNNVTGILTNTDPSSIKEAILKLINNPELQTKLGQNARQLVLDNYSLDTQIKKEIQIYMDLVEKQ